MEQEGQWVQFGIFYCCHTHTHIFVCVCVCVCVCLCLCVCVLVTSVVSDSETQARILE